MPDGPDRIESELTEAAARDHLRSYAEQMHTAVTQANQPDSEQARIALETALDAFDRVIKYGTAVAYHRQEGTNTQEMSSESRRDEEELVIGPDLRTLSSDLAIDRLVPFDLEDLRTTLTDEATTGIESSATLGLANGPMPGPNVTGSGQFERWLITEFGVVLSIPIRDSETAIRRVLESIADRYEAARIDSTTAITELPGILPILESLYRLYVRLTLEKPLPAATEDELGRTMVSLTAAVTAGFGDE